MDQRPGTEMQIADYFRQSEEKRNSHTVALQALLENIADRPRGRDEKKIIAALLENIEAESDHTRLKLYRQALELFLRTGNY